MSTTEVALISGAISGVITAIGLFFNFLLGLRRERRHTNLQDQKLELEAFNAVRAEAEILRKELRDTIGQQHREIEILEKDNAQLRREVEALEKEHDRLIRDHSTLTEQCVTLTAQNKLLEADLRDLRERLRKHQEEERRLKDQT